MTLLAYLAAACLLLATAWVVFRMLVRRSYRERGRLTPLVGFLELLVWLLYVAFPTLYNPIMQKLNPFERMMFRMAKSPGGDSRDWDAIAAWAARIAAGLKEGQPA